MKVVILTEGRASVGFGHITRCLSLTHAFKKKGIKPHFFVHGDKNVRSFLKRDQYEIINWMRNKRILRSLKDCDIAIVDSYLADRSFYLSISNLVKVPVYFDDDRRLNYPRGIVVNAAPHTQDLNYHKTSGVNYLLGEKYIPLRKEFLTIPTKKIRKEINSVLLLFGGRDMHNMIVKLLHLLSKKYFTWTKQVVVGGRLKNVGFFKKIKDAKTEFLYDQDATGMKKAMLKADLAISASGQTLYELARVGVPTIAIMIAKNQVNNVKGLKKIGFIEYAGLGSNKKIFHKVNVLIDKMTSFHLRQQKYIIGRRFVDGKGSDRIVKAILKKL